MTHMNAAPLLQRRLIRWPLVFGGWTLLGLFFSLQSLVSYNASGYEVRLGQTLIYQLGNWYAWGLLTPLILLLARRFRIERQQWRRGLLTHIGLGMLMAPLQVVLSTALRLAGFWGFGLMTGEQLERLISGAAGSLLTNSFDGFATYWVILGLAYLFDYYHKYRERELRASQLEGQLAQAELTALKMQLHPHFLFNTLHSISALVSEDPEAAERMIARLSELLRLTLENAGTQEVSLRQELAFLERYLEIEQTRFHDRLTVAMDIDPEVLDARVPNLILQPLVENAIRHGIAPRPTPGRVEIAATHENGTLALQVRDNGPGLPSGDGQPREGVGLKNTRARLAQLYGPHHRFHLHNAPEGGLHITLEIPLAR